MEPSTDALPYASAPVDADESFALPEILTLLPGDAPVLLRCAEELGFAVRVA